MFPDRATSDEFWCPAGDNAASVTAHPRVTDVMTPVEWASLSRLAVGEWVSDLQIERLQHLGLAEIVFGQALLTRLGRVTLGVSEQE